MSEGYYVNVCSQFRQRLISSLGLKAYYELLQKIDQTQLLLDLAIEKLEEYKKQVKEVATATKTKSKKP